MYWYPRLDYHGVCLSGDSLWLFTTVTCHSFRDPSRRRCLQRLQDPCRLGLKIFLRGVGMCVSRNVRSLCTFVPTFTNSECRKLLQQGVFAVNKIKNLTSVEVLETIKEILLKGYHYCETLRLGSVSISLSHGIVKNWSVIEIYACTFYCVW